MTEEPLSPEQRLQQAIQFHQGGDLPKAEDIYREVLEVNPDNPTALHLLGTIAHQSGSNDKALILIGRALEILPQYPEALNNMGNVFAEMERLEEALLSYQEAVAQKPDYVIAYNHLGNTLRGLGRLDESAASYEKAIALDPGFAEAHYNLGHLYLLMGRLREGWKEFAWRRQVAELNHAHRPYTSPVWDGGNPDGKTLFFYPEQGLGDLLQFVRYLPLVAAEGGRILLETPTQMARLLQGFDGAHTLIPSEAPLAEFDCHASLLDLPGIMGTNLETIPAPVNYMTANPELTRAWAERLGPRENFRVGMVWGATLNTPMMPSDPLTQVFSSP